VIEYCPAEPVEAKGKQEPEPVPVWEAVAARARLGADVSPVARTALVGRQRELGVLRDALARVRAERTPQLVTLVGVPGVGKSRLVYELSRIADADPELFGWRQGRSLSYGEGISFWALAEIVKAQQAGILEDDTPGQAQTKLAQTITGLMTSTPEADWVARHVSALAGAGGSVPTGGERRSEAFAAWRQFFEALAGQRPLVLVFEDLHWADDGLLDFVDYLADWAGGGAVRLA
jgi:predicted ATPase